MGRYTDMCVAIGVQVALIFGYIHHYSSIRRLHYQYQEAEQRYHALTKEKERRSQLLQSDHNYTRILRTAQQAGMRTIPFNHVTHAKQEAS